MVEWALLLNGFYRWVHHRDLTGITFGFADMVMALFCAGELRGAARTSCPRSLRAASILISFGAWIGKIGPEQLLFIALCEAAVYCTNSFIIEALLEVRQRSARRFLSPIASERELSSGARCGRLHGHSHVRRLLWAGGQQVPLAGRHARAVRTRTCGYVMDGILLTCARPVLAPPTLARHTPVTRFP